MSSLNQLAQVAQLAGTKRKILHDAESHSPLVRGLVYDPFFSSNLQPWPTVWPYPQPSFQRSTLNLQYHVNSQPSSLSGPQAGTTTRQHGALLLDDAQFSVRPDLEQVPSRCDGFIESSASPSTEDGSRNWQDAASMTNTSYSSSPKLDDTFEAAQFRHSMGFPSHRYGHGFRELRNNFEHLYHAHPSNIQTNFGAPVQSKPNPNSNNQLRHGTVQSLDCEDVIACSDPSCQDGVPCSGQHLLACDKDNCDDAIPCPAPNLSHFAALPATSYPDPICEGGQDCTLSSSGEDVCCSDQCPEEIRCPSPCFEQACNVPPCDVDHMTQMPWEWTHGVVPCGSMNGCVDPRHTFHNSEPFESGLFSWGKRLQEQFSSGVCDNERVVGYSVADRKEDPCCSGRLNAHNVHPELKKQDHPGAPNAQAHTHKNCCSSTKHKHQHQSGAGRLAREHRHTCQWVTHGDSFEPDAEICGLEFSSAQTLQEHILTHVEGLQREDDLFPCRWRGCRHRFCDGFLARPKLKRHLMVHTGATPYKCDEPGCTVEMKTKDALDKHKRTHTGSKPYRCTHPNCESRFATSTELKTHLIVHSGQKPHKCPRCGDCFADSSNLSKHKKVHEVPKFKCPDCDYKMKRWDQMRRHFKSQGHALYITENKVAEAEYKRHMQEAFDKLTPEQRILPLSREGSIDSSNSDAALSQLFPGRRGSAQLKRENDAL